ncbi:homoserine kinase [Solemya pervernicosa gill symbiont]|uniref:Homoserine kinase n=2 Tax=Gammaproteobacteria incertae sedis TaxID=118884 RepID=A0A1T2L4J0_9GAMM|nr:homoserine kinase [Candidatus Reidiella endopervernicosa]OOZ40025.1 homoserine kinase [Solemya pervernicosa gill symbiont]QKQ25310.1 homoserine kinase [Candidatus Reidiella endopervernicosa]
MSVYTPVEQPELNQFLEHYDLGTLVSHTGISAGIENTNYFVTTTQGEYVLTLFESLSADELPYFLDMMAFLAEHEVPSAHPMADREGHYLRELNGKPAALVQRLSGANVELPNEQQCAALGKSLGHMHSCGVEFPHQRDNGRGPHWWAVTTERMLPALDEDSRELLKAELAFQEQYRHSDLPRGIIHADLFRDNAMFEGDTLTGIIDFYYACNDILLYDLAVTVNDWCGNEDGSLNELKLRAMLSAYHSERPLSSDEHAVWPVMLRAAALRFWLSRLQDKHFPREGEITHIKDPDVFKNILIDRIEHRDAIHAIWL